MLRARRHRTSLNTLVVGVVVFSTLAVFRTCGDSRIGIEPPSIRDERANGGLRQRRIHEHNTGVGKDFRRRFEDVFWSTRGAIREASDFWRRGTGGTGRAGANVP
jgi:hypothetical protein